MPRRDGTGPMGMGPMTGLGAGFCYGVVSSKYMNPERFGYNYGRGFRRMRCRINNTPVYGNFNYAGEPGEFKSSEYEKEILSSQVEFLENQLKNLKKYLSSLDETAE